MWHFKGKPIHPRAMNHRWLFLLFIDNLEIGLRAKKRQHGAEEMVPETPEPPLTSSKTLTNYLTPQSLTVLIGRMGGMEGWQFGVGPRERRCCSRFMDGAAMMEGQRLDVGPNHGLPLFKVSSMTAAAEWSTCWPQRPIPSPWCGVILRDQPAHWRWVYSLPPWKGHPFILIRTEKYSWYVFLSPACGSQPPPPSMDSQSVHLMATA